VKVLISSVVIAGVCFASAACRKAPAAQAATKTAATPGQAASPAKPVPAQLPDVVAHVNGEAVTKDELEHMLRTMEMQAGQPIPPDRRDEIVRSSLDRLVAYHLLIQESRTRNVTVSDNEIGAKVQEFRGQFQSDEAFKQALVQRGWPTIDALRKDVRNDLTVSKLMEADAATQPAVTEQDARDFYTKNPGKFQQPETVRASHILIKVDANADAAAKKKARAEIDGVLKRLRAGADFAKLAQEHSQDGSAAQGGDLGYFPRERMVPAFADAAFALKPGQISNVVESQFGYHVIKVTDRKPGRTVPFEEVSPQIGKYLAQERRQQRAGAFVDELKKKARIEVLI
jgi:peptidyl-prolyl cis-trans isomerase C